MNSKDRKIENRLRRHQERQQLAREFEKILHGETEEDFDILPRKVKVKGKYEQVQTS